MFLFTYIITYIICLKILFCLGKESEIQNIFTIGINLIGYKNVQLPI